MDISKFITRKFVAAALCSVPMFIAWVLCQWLSHAREYFSALMMALGGVLTAYNAGNVLQDHILKGKAPDEEKK